MKRAVRFFTRLVAILVVAVAAPAVAIGGLLVATHARDATGPCTCPGAPIEQPVAVFTGQVRERVGDSFVFEVEERELGKVPPGQQIEALGVELAPWRRYRVQVFELDGTRYISAFHPAETKDIAMPVDIEAFGALRWHALMAVIAAPLFVIAALYLLISSHMQSRREYAGVRIRGLRRVRRVRRRGASPRSGVQFGAVKPETNAR